MQDKQYKGRKKSFSCDSVLREASYEWGQEGGRRCDVIRTSDDINVFTTYLVRMHFRRASCQFGGSPDPIKKNLYNLEVLFMRQNTTILIRETNDLQKEGNHSHLINSVIQLSPANVRICA